LAEQKHDDSFKVIDRRPFTPEGELRKEAVEEERREQETAKILSEKEKAKSQSAHEHAHGKEQPVPAAASAEVQASDGIAPSRQFQMLVDFLARNAAAMLGGMTDPRTGQAFLDLEGAREMIDLLDVLREKTRGNLAKVDDDLLVEVLGSLKLTFMEVSKAATEAMAKKAGVKK